MGWKIALSDAPSRVDKCESVYAGGFNATFGENAWNTDTVFVWSPALGDSQIAVCNSADAVMAVLRLDGLVRTAGYVPAQASRLGSTPSIPVIMATYQRAAPLSASLVVSFNFGMNTGLVRFMRINETMEATNFSGISTRLATAIHGVTEFELNGNKRILLRAGMHSKQAITTMSGTQQTNFDMTDATPLSGWLFRVVTANTATNAPIPEIRMHAIVRVQRELNYVDSYLADALKHVGIDVVEKRANEAGKPVETSTKLDMRTQVEKDAEQLIDEKKKNNGKLRGSYDQESRAAMAALAKKNRADTAKKALDAAVNYLGEGHTQWPPGLRDHKLKPGKLGKNGKPRSAIVDANGGITHNPVRLTRRVR